ncbi:DinB superfamily protein [Pseudarcicella hirudinis]|uniref:DinB superfamily protein n=1 Tax=Pseudarcicella hirudinis TaxID=1079859 RepID=A0A1I5RST1_9BACT|nr:DinB family protein [Pseudarcicella hirudinis]SFP61568.1 DinB superfamily protein [Pseudarcicella hirudinis]
MKQIKWFDRNFDFLTDQNIFPSILERLLGTPIRLEDKVKSIAENKLSLKINGTWTIKENIGHLIDLEPLWQGRFEDIINSEKELRPTDLQNTQTDLANHNEKDIEDLLSQFRAIRNLTLSKLEDIDEETIFKFSLHPRLKTPMRTMDLFLFVAEHDDHHLARITEIIKS